MREINIWDTLITKTRLFNKQKRMHFKSQMYKLSDALKSKNKIESQFFYFKKILNFYYLSKAISIKWQWCSLEKNWNIARKALVFTLSNEHQ